MLQVKAQFLAIQSLHFLALQYFLQLIQLLWTSFGTHLEAVAKTFSVEESVVVALIVEALDMTFVEHVLQDKAQFFAIHSIHFWFLQ